MTKLIPILVLAFTAVASAQPAPAEAQPTPAEAQPASSETQPASPEAQPASPEAQPAPSEAQSASLAPSAAPSSARQACVDAMNADPEFAKSIVATVDKQIDQRTIDAHVAAAEQIAENERHVILAYAAMWVLAALFVIFLWRRQQALVAELAQLRKDLDAAAKENA